jgi:cysteine-rich repeat protein
MRFSAIAVTCVALAAQVTPTLGMGDFSCETELDPCLEVVITDKFQCGSGFIEYCLQPKVPYPSTCKDLYSHMNVYFDGDNAHLQNTDPADGEAECPGTHSDDDTCEFDSVGDKKNCNLLPSFAGLLNSPTDFNVGYKCGNSDKICITVPTTSTVHPEVFFAVKDRSGCIDPINGWQCNGPSDNSCSCSGSQPACVYEPITDCTSTCGNGVLDPGEECDDGNNVDDDGCTNCERDTDPGTGCPGTTGCNGDPHFKTWRGKHYDFHGECDLVLLHSPKFGAGLGLDIHIRTKLRRDMSYISAAVLRMGTDTLEVESQGVYYLNGVLGAELPEEFSGFAFSHTQPTDKQHVFEINLGGRERLKVKTYKDFVSVLIDQAQSKHFGDSVGLMGDFRKGHMIARDGKTILDDPNAFGQEWQVLESETTLFQTLRLPQHPMECTMPPPMQASQLRRRLLESSPIAEVAAEEACAHWGEGKDDCVFDVLTTGDLEMAVMGAY